MSLDVRQQLEVSGFDSVSARLRKLSGRDPDVGLPVLLEWLLNRADAVHGLKSLSNCSTDGLRFLESEGNDQNRLLATGLLYVLPTGQVPVQIEILLIDDELRYTICIGRDDEKWQRMNESKQWNETYLLATVERNKEWDWIDELTGFVGADGKWRAAV